MKTVLPERMVLNSATEVKNLENGAREYTKNNYSQALALLCPIAEEGNVIAHSLLGRMYLRKAYFKTIRKQLNGIT